MIPHFHTDFSISDSLIFVRKSVLIYETIILGVSGAIQHTEGIKDTKLFVAINQDESAPIFNTADYGMACDMKDVLEAYLKL